MDDSSQTLLRIRGLTKSFAVPVLRDFDLAVRPGEVHGLVGSNGAGKSTLSRILAGLLPADGGEMVFAGRLHQPGSRREAQAAGVTLLLQELNVLPTLSVAENLFLHQLPSRFGLLDQGRLRGMARQALVRVGLGELDPDTPARELGVGMRQLVELAAALAEQCRLLILDEPTAALTSRETGILFDHIRELRRQGVSILYISHRMEELRAICDRVTVMRDGRRVDTLSADQASTPELVRLMAGRETTGRASVRRGEPGAVALNVRELRAGTAVRGVSFSVRGGEILGIGGLVGAGRTETLRAVFGADDREGGVIEIAGREARIRTPADAVALGIGLVPEDRKHHGLLLPLNLRVNVTLASLRNLLIRPDREDAIAGRMVERLEVKCDSTGQAVGTLSGGNQQKIVIGRWLLPGAGILLLDEPTRGVDAAAKDAIHRLLRELAEDGKAIVVVSSELPELMSLCDRIAMMSAGRIVREFLPDEWTTETLTEAAFRAHVAAPNVS